MNPMNEVVISKATINIGVGEAGEKLSRAMTLIENMTGQTPVKTYSKVTNPEWGIRKRQPIACKVTLRGEKAEDAIKLVLEGINNKLRPSQFDAQGNVSFGIKEHIDIPVAFIYKSPFINQPFANFCCYFSFCLILRFIHIFC